MNVVFSFTSNLSEYVSTVIYSLLKNNSNVSCIYIFSDKPVLFKGITCEVKYYLYKEYLTNINSLNKTFLYTDAALVRLFFQDILDVDKILYLDCDVIIDKDISSFYNTDLTDKCAAMVKEIGSENYFGYSKEGEVLPVTYNSGVILMNLEEIRKLNFTSEIIRLLNTYEYFLPDQDVFNVVYANRILDVSGIYNYHFPVEGESIPNDIAIYHWGGFYKENWIYDLPYSEIWKKYESESNIALVAQ